MFVSKLRLPVLLMLALLGAAPGMFVAAQGQHRVYLPVVSGPPPAPSPFIVRNTSQYREQGSYFFIGEVVNVSDRPLQSVSLKVEVTDSSIGSPQESRAYVSPRYLAPGEVGLFDYIYSTATPDVSISLLGVDRYQEVSSPPPLRLTVLSLRFQPDSPNAPIEGEIRNDTTETAYYPSLTIGLYDAAGRLQAVYGMHVFEEMLEPGQTSGFQSAVINRYDPSWTVRTFMYTWPKPSELVIRGKIRPLK